MRICYLANARDIHTRRLIKYFKEKGHEVYLISYKPFGNNKDILGVSLFLLGRGGPQIKVISAVAYLLSDVVRIRKIVRKLKPDLLHAHGVILYGWLGVLSGFHPIVISPLGSDVLVAPKKSKIWKLITKFTFGRADLTLTTSQYLKGYLVTEFKLPEHRVMALPWGSDLKIFHKGYETEVKELRIKLGINDSNFVILSPRRLEEDFRTEYIIRAMPYVLAKYPGVFLILLKGRGKDSIFETQIDNLTKELGIAQNIRMINQELNPEEMAALYNASDVLISIPKSDQFSACIREGMACGVIPIVANLEVYNQYLTNEKNAFFVNPQDPKEIAQRIIHCIEHPELKDRFYQVNREIVEEEGNWDKNTLKIEALFESILNHKSGRV